MILRSEGCLYEENIVGKRNAEPSFDAERAQIRANFAKRVLHKTQMI